MFNSQQGKMSLEKIKVQSFVVTLGQDEKNRIKGKGPKYTLGGQMCEITEVIC